MATTTVIQQSLVDRNGNIQVHGQDAIYLPVKLYTDATLTTQLDISGETMIFRIEGASDVTLVADPSDPFGLLLTIPDLTAAGIIVSPTTPINFALIDTTSVKPVVWDGQIITRGWEGTP